MCTLLLGIGGSLLTILSGVLVEHFTFSLLDLCLPGFCGLPYEIISAAMAGPSVFCFNCLLGAGLDATLCCGVILPVAMGTTMGMPLVTMALGMCAAWVYQIMGVCWGITNSFRGMASMFGTPFGIPGASTTPATSDFTEMSVPLMQTIGSCIPGL
jgi:hypothetical protein